MFEVIQVRFNEVSFQNLSQGTSKKFLGFARNGLENNFKIIRIHPDEFPL